MKISRRWAFCNEIIYFAFKCLKIIYDKGIEHWLRRVCGRAAASRMTGKNSATHFGRYCRQNQLRRTPPSEYKPKYRATCCLEKLIAPDSLGIGRPLSRCYTVPPTPLSWRTSCPVNSNKRDASFSRGIKINDRGVTGGGYTSSGVYEGGYEGRSDGGAAVLQ